MPVILLVEDDADHAFLALMALREDESLVVHHVDTGTKCLAFLLKQAPYEAAPDVDCLLLDLHLPGINGKEVLRAILDQRIERPKKIFVTSNSPGVALPQELKGLPCDALLSKPVELEHLRQAWRD